MTAFKLSALLVASCALSGCIKSALVDGQIAGTREGSVAFDTIGDWELAYSAASAGIVQFEGMHVLAPHNQNALFMLSKSYAGYAYAFAEDDMEAAEDLGDRSRAEYHKMRAMRAYSKSLEYGLQLWHERGFDGFEAARASEGQLHAWLDAHFKEASDAGDLFWPGYAWLARTNLQKDNAEAVANLYVGLALVEKAVQLDRTYNHFAGLITLAAYHSRSATAELAQGGQLFEEAVQRTGRKSLIVLYNYATKLACAKADAASYRRLLGEVLAAEDPEPSLRLTNVIAQRRARRWLDAQRMFSACGIESETGGTDGPS